MSNVGSKTIFVANIPFDVSEEQLRATFSEVGPVANVEIKFDPNTGRSKGYAFVHYFDDLTAQSAVRNLHEVHVNGRNLRVELSTDEPQRKRGDNNSRSSGARGGSAQASGGPGGYGAPPPMSAGGQGGYGPPGGGYGGPGGYGPPGGAGGPGGPGGSGPPSGGPGPGYDAPPAARGGDFAPPPERVDISLLPQGQDLPTGVKATDAISKTLAAIQPGQMQEVMAGMKTLISTNPEQARALLQQKPQLSYALFQAMLLLNIVDSSVLQRITPLPPVAAAPPGGAFPPYPPSNAGPANGYSQSPSSYPAQQSYRPPVPADPRDPRGDPRDPRFAHPQQQARPPAPSPASIPPQALAQLEMLPEDQRTMLMQVLQMTPDQIAGLDATQQASVMQLRQQFLS